MKWQCRRKGHDWLLPDKPREFIPVTDFCLRCNERRAQLPWGWCLGWRGSGHPIAEHYDQYGQIVHHPTCPRPR